MIEFIIFKLYFKFSRKFVDIIIFSNQLFISISNKYISKYLYTFFDL